MNNYPVWWDNTITIYNKYEDEQTHIISWYRKVLDKCFFKNVGNKVSINNVELETDDTICRIPKKDDYMKPHLWVALPNDQKSEYFTIRVGDIIVPDEIQEDINEYIEGHRSTDFIAKYKNLQGCITVEAVGNNTGIGRGNEHYRVSGK